MSEIGIKLLNTMYRFELFSVMLNSKLFLFLLLNIRNHKENLLGTLLRNEPRYYHGNDLLCIVICGTKD